MKRKSSTQIFVGHSVLITSSDLKRKQTAWRPDAVEYVPAEQRAQSDEVLTPAHQPHQTIEE